MAVGLGRALNMIRWLPRKSIAERNADTDELIGNSSSMTKLKAKIGRVGNANGSVLIRGESGAGKELVACGPSFKSTHCVRC